MSDDVRLSDDERRALDALLRLPRAEPSPEARRRAREAFLAGSIATLPERRSRRPFWLSMSAVTALAAVLALAIVGTTPTMDWVVLDVVEPDGVTRDGAPVVVGDRLDAGELVTAEGSELEVQLGDRLRFRLQPGTRIDLPAAPGRWFDRGRELYLTSGEIFGTSGDQKLGFPMVFSTDELDARLVGTTFAVFRTDTTSCVCLWNGAITVTPFVGDPVDLEPGKRVWIFKDGSPAEIRPLDARETMKLQMTHDAGLATPPED